MWKIIFVTVFPCVFGAATRSIELLEGPLWSSQLAESLSSIENLPSLNSDLSKQRYQYEDPRNRDSDTFFRPVSDKRALAMFARWSSINSIGKNRTPIRSPIFFEPQDGISAQPRAKGKPLRWG